ncbi:MAG: bifunctional acetate--CoA ligase family protein/GNAT family N-acetyltransferase [Hydrogenophaga sp.]|uniref:bifunctional acetate--CoA ligase family protein/GNAT family N-acetyltransferase n=1 Tax=Hydrogenophaga sp. TaxID=1904254 RepID=UPI0026107652|nr:bifunctional acetate--CoA ligase family protein/GNAT family N-acetyltransferase [Hydrogenophaga sp.]MCV0439396.1 bifunctional acetate--CoA ligase family protein/GNAT family N-acetyltransferase [Hydrogenophaga sp.]
MSVRHLDRMFQPRSVAVIGVSRRPDAVGALVWRNLRAGGFAGPLWAVNHRPFELDGQTVHASVDALPGTPDLAVICTPAPSVPGLVAQLGHLGTRAAIVLTAGLREGRAPDGRSLEQAMLDAARPHVLRILGPNCIGALVPGQALNASFAPGQALPGELAFVTQSGALATAMLDWASERGIGFSHFISLGDSADVDFGDLLDLLGSDGHTRAILLYIESVKHARKFMSAARAAARNKPVVLVKAGRRPDGARAAASHTGALTGSDAVFDAAVRRAGMLRVDTLEALFDAAQTLSRVRHWRGPRLAVLTNGGGAGVLAVDALGSGELATLSDDTLAQLDACLPTNWSHGNPVDIIGDAPPARYLDALRVLRAAPEVDGILFMHAPTAIASPDAIAQACLPLLREADRPVLACWLGGQRVAAARELFGEHGIACYATPERAAAAWLQLRDHHAAQAALLQLPESRAELDYPDREGARALVDAALASGQEWLDELDAKRLLGAYGIPCVATERVDSVDAALAAAGRIGYPVALKIVSPAILHKSDVGGVALNLADAAQLRAEALRMRERVANAQPDAPLSGFTVQAMAVRPRAIETIVGIGSDPVFGPVLLFGEGGTAVEVRADRAIALPPLNAVLARGLIARTRVAGLLHGYRGRPPASEDAIVDVLLRLSQLASDLAPVAELDINPLLVDEQGAIALDARVRVRHAEPTREGSHLALRPYPSGLESDLAIGGETLRVRPIRPDDGERLARFYENCSPEDLRLRFFFTRREVPTSELARYCQIDYEREMAFVALSGDTLCGEARAVCDPDNDTAEFAVQVAGDWQGRGLGWSLLGTLIGHLRARGTRELVGSCLETNHGMVGLARQMGFHLYGNADGTLQLRLSLQ